MVTDFKIPRPKANRLGAVRPASVMALVYTASVPFDGLALGSRSLPFLTGILLLALLFVDRLSADKDSSGVPSHWPRLMPMLVYLIFCASSTMWSLSASLTVTRLMTLGLLCATALGLAHLFQLIPSKHIAIALTTGASLAASFVLLAPPNIDSRRSANGNANDIAVALLMGVACALYLWVQSRGLPRWIGAAAMPLLLYGTLLTGSRTAVIGLLLMFICGLSYLVVARKGKSALLLLMAVSALAWGLFSLPTSVIPPRLFSIATELQNGTLSERTRIWDAILDRGFDPLGVGAGAGPYYMGVTLGQESVSHNVFLGVLLEGGILGLGLFIWAVLSAIRAATKSPHLALLVYISPVIVAGALTLSLDARRSLWFVFALAWSSIPLPSGVSSETS